MGDQALDGLLARVRACHLCAEDLALGPRPVLSASSGCRILIIGQAPGSRVHQSGVPWDDPSGDRLRHWMGLDNATFYNPQQIAIIPMGFCYPGKGKSGDLPPRKECAPTWHQPLLAELPDIQLTLLIGQYAQAYYLPERDATLTATVKRWREYWPAMLPLPHPSPRNRRWFKNNPWFDQQVVPVIQAQVASLLL